MRISKFISQFWRVFIARKWDWTTYGPPDQLGLYSSVLKAISFQRSDQADGRYQLCVISFMLLHAARLVLCCIYGAVDEQWYDKWLWADIGTAFGDAYRVVFNINVAYGYAATALVMVTNYYATHRLRHSDTPWYSCWYTFLGFNRRLAQPTGCYTMADRVLLWKIAFISQLMSLLLGFEVGTFVTLFTSHTLLHDFPFDRPFGEIFAILGLNLLWIILYDVSVYLIFLSVVTIYNALVCQAISYTIQVQNITRWLKRITSSGEDVYSLRQSAVSLIKDMDSISSQLASQKTSLDLICGAGITASITVALFWLYLATYLAVDFILILLSYSILSAALMNAIIGLLASSSVSAVYEKYIDQLFLLNAGLPSSLNVKRLINKTLKGQPQDSFTFGWWVCFPIRLSTLQEVMFDTHPA